MAGACENRTHQATSKAAKLVLKTKTPPLMGVYKRHWPPGHRTIMAVYQHFLKLTWLARCQERMQVIGATGQNRVKTGEEYDERLERLLGEGGRCQMDAGKP